MKITAITLAAVALGICVVFAVYGIIYNVRRNAAPPVDISSYTGDGDDVIHFMNTGGSDAILIESNGKFALVDCAEDTDNPRGLESLDLEGYEQVEISVRRHEEGRYQFFRAQHIFVHFGIVRQNPRPCRQRIQNHSFNKSSRCRRLNPFVDNAGQPSVRSERSDWRGTVLFREDGTPRYIRVHSD